MNDLLKSIKAHLYEKATSPLFGMFAISWALWNYKFLLVLVSSMKVKEKLEYISLNFYTDMSSCILVGALYPAITTALIIFAYPHPAKFVYEYSRKRQKELREIKQEIEDETPLTIEESRNIRRELIELELKYEKELEYRSLENKRLKEMLDKQNNDIHPDKINITKNVANDINHSNTSIHLKKVTSEQKELLMLISSNGRMSEKSILAKSDKDRVKAEYNLGELLEQRLIKDFYSQNAEKSYEVTHEGRKLLVNDGLIK